MRENCEKKSQEPCDTTKGNRKRVFIIDDHPLLRKGIGHLINKEMDMIVCGEAADALSALDAIAATKCDVAIVDISLGGTNGIELIKNIRVRHPKLPVLVHSMHEEGLYAPRALRAGALGYVMKQEAGDTLLRALRKVLRGEVYVSERLSNQMINALGSGRPAINTTPVEALSDRELEVFGLIGQGEGTRAIAQRLHLSVKTVDSHRANVKEKLNLKNANQLLHHAITWVQSESAQAQGSEEQRV